MHRSDRLSVLPSSSWLRSLIAWLVLCCATITTARAQGAWSTQFDQVGFGTSGRTFALGTWRGQLIAGTLHSPWRDGARLDHIARFDGVRWHALGSGLVGGHVRTVVEFQGDLYAGGSFVGSSGVSMPGVARWDGAQWHAVGAGLAGEVFALCVHQGSLYAAGDFQQSGAATVKAIARWTGSTWVEVGGGVRDSVVFLTTARALASDGTDLFVGGDFDIAGNVSARRIAAWNGTSWRALGSGITGNWVWTLAVHNGRLFAGGIFTNAGGQTADSLAAWNGTAWQAIGIATPGTLFGSSVYSLCEWNGDLYVGGAFTPPNSPLARCIARYDGAQLHALPVGVDLPELGAPAVYALCAWNQRLCAGGEFQIAGNAVLPPSQSTTVNHVASFDGTKWEALGAGLGADGVVHTLSRFQGQTIAAGEFTTIGGAVATCLARFDGERWHNLAEFDNRVLDACEHNGELWVAGEFYYMNGVVADGVARFDGTNWHTVGGGPGPSRAYSIASYQGQIHIGTAGGPKRWNGSTWQTFTPVLSGTFTSLHVHNGVLWLGKEAGGTTGTFLYAWDGTTLTAPANGPNGSVEGLGSFGGDLIVGGRFTHVGSLPARAIAKWNGSAWSTFGTGIQGATVKAIATWRGELVVGGDFSAMQGATADYVARWTGSAWAPLGPAHVDGVVYTLLPDDTRGELLVGGWFFHFGGIDSPYIAAFESTPYWSDAGGALASSPALTGSGRLIAGTPVGWHLSSAATSSVAVFVMGFASNPVPLFGGTLVPSPDLLLLVPTDPIGSASLTTTWPGVTGFQCWTQAWILDPNAPQGAAASNTLRLRGP